MEDKKTMGFTTVYNSTDANKSYKVEVKKYQGEKHLVVPVVMMVEGVHNGSHGPLYHPAEELSKFPQAWNGTPVIIYHPTDEKGQYISANIPEVIDEQVVGRVFNVVYEDGKLKGEVWLNENKTAQIAPEVLKMVREGKAIDVSVGVFTEDIMQEGNWNGENYIGIAKNHRPDHLAILPDVAGACSLKDGCGLGVNKEDGGLQNMSVDNLKYDGVENTPWTAPTLSDFGVDGNWFDLSNSEKERIASHFLVGDANAETFADLKFPVVNPKTNKLNERALRAVISGRGAAVRGISDAERKRARRKAYELLIEEFDAELEIPSMENLEECTSGKGKGGKKMKEKVEILVQSKHFNEEDIEWLESLEDKHLDKLITMAQKKEETVDKKELEVKALSELKEKFKDLNTYLEMAPAEVKEQIVFGMRLMEDKKQEYINYIKTNAMPGAFTDDELKAMKFYQLEKLVKAIPAKVDYSVQGLQANTVQYQGAKPVADMLLPFGVKVS